MNRKTKKIFLIAGIILLIIVTILAIVYSYLSWKIRKDIAQQTATEEKKTEALMGEVESITGNTIRIKNQQTGEIASYSFDSETKIKKVPAEGGEMQKTSKEDLKENIKIVIIFQKNEENILVKEIHIFNLK